MGPSNHETEIKLRFDSASEAVERLRSMGAREKQPRTFEDNVVYDDGEGSLKRDERLLRLRSCGGTCLLTFKQRVGEPCDDTAEPPRHKVREEVETTVGDFDAMRGIFERLGYRKVYRYQKFRAKYLLDDVEVAVDETPLGCFVELEGPAPAIDRLAARLGFGPGDYITVTYLELHRRVAGDEPGDLLLDRAGAD